MISVGPVEWLWVGLNTATLVLTLLLLADAERDRRTVRRFNGRAREIVTANSVRREFLRAIVQALLLALTIPSLLSDRDITLSGPVLTLIAIALVLLAQSVLDTRERKQLKVVVARELAVGAPVSPPGSAAS
jgi:hypothetical protein